MADTRMTRGEREAFLADVRVGLVAMSDGQRGPLAVPVWYGYEPGGEIWFSVEEGFTDLRLGAIQQGDLLSSLGHRVFSNAELVAAFSPADACLG
jgi:hypothetical protein